MMNVVITLSSSHCFSGPTPGAASSLFFIIHHITSLVSVKEEGVYHYAGGIYVDPTPPAEEQTYWYFCLESRNYYSYVKQCPNGWLKVVPPQAPPDYED